MQSQVQPSSSRLYTTTSSSYDDLTRSKKSNGGKTSGGGGNILQRTCLRPKYSLRLQLFLSFGLVGITVTICVMITSIVTTIHAGNEVKTESRQNLESWAQNSATRSSRYAADTLTKKLENFHGLVGILVDVTQDRFVGYPYHDGYVNDTLVPFRDGMSGTNKYPLESKPLPLDWEIDGNKVYTDDIFDHHTDNNGNDIYDEHVQHRQSWYPNKWEITTSSAAYWMQGLCDPNVTDPTSPSYYPNCTDANNDISTGGAVQPTSTNAQIAKRAADLNFVVKPLYEYHQEVRHIVISFTNSGAGSGILFPGAKNDGWMRYQSIGCDWMRAPNPRNPTKPIATEEEIGRCHKRGEIVSGKEYNTLERGWCAQQALDPDKSHTIGPFPNLFNMMWMIGFGRAVYDRVTNELIACVIVDIGVEQIAEIIDNVTATPNSQTALVRWDLNGTVVASSTWDTSHQSEEQSVKFTVPTISNIGMGVTNETYNELKSLIDFNSQWDPEEVRDTYENTVFHDEGKMIFGFPIPVPPSTYDPEYTPDFMIVISMDESEVFEAADIMDEAVDEEVQDLIIFTLVVGFVGLGVLTITISLVSHYITKPLNWMNRIGDQIVDNYGQNLDDGTLLDVNTHRPVGRCTPKTEIVVLVQEFQKMVIQFSGTGTASIVKQELSEIKNPFHMYSEFQDLYQSRQDGGFKYKYPFTRALPQRRHLGPNVTPQNLAGNSNHSMSQSYASLNNTGHRHRVYRSSLFWWIVGSIVMPLLITTIGIAVIVTLTVSNRLNSMVTDVEDSSLETYVLLETTSLETATKMRASYATEVISQSVRDLYVLTRVAGWLLFGAIQRSNSFTEMMTSSGTDGKEEAVPCDCNWVRQGYDNDQCSVYNGTDTRYLQQMFYEGGGDGTSEPTTIMNDNGSQQPPLKGPPNPMGEFVDTPEMAEFGMNQTTTPAGSEKQGKGNLSSENGGNLSTNYDETTTTNDRLRILSALSVIQMPLFNYDLQSKSDKPLGDYIGLEENGSSLLVGYSGCYHARQTQASATAAAAADAASIVENDNGNNAWYVNGKKVASKKGHPPLYVTPPYQLTSDQTTLGQSATLPLINPKTQQLIGQTLADFVPQSIFDSLLSDTPLPEGGFPILITPKDDDDDNGGKSSHTVIGPLCDDLCNVDDTNGFPIETLASFPKDEGGAPPPGGKAPPPISSSHKSTLRSIQKDMLNGKSSTTSYTDPTNSEENVYIAYAPVNVQSFHPLDTSDYTRGVRRYNSLIYSLALAEPESSLLAQFHSQGIDEALSRQVNVSIYVLASLIAVATLLVIFISSRVTVSITVPMLHLLDVVLKINGGDIKEDITIQVNGGSREVSRVCGTFQKLYKVVRFANTAYFAGDLDHAYNVLVDALTVFTNLNNQKAMGVANNNIGNTMLTAYRTLVSTGQRSVCGMDKDQIIMEGMARYDVAIDLGERAYEEFHAMEGWSKRCLVFMQQLSNRYFNRAMFLLTIRGDQYAPDDAKRMGFSDLAVAKDMDTEVVSQRLNEGVKCDFNEHFHLLIGRVNGLLTLLEMGYPDKWYMEELFEDAIHELTQAIRYPTNKLFRDLGPPGHMQQLDSALIRYVQLKGNSIVEGARIAIRMLVEDEYLLHDAGLMAIETLVQYCDAIGTENDVDIHKARKLLMKYHGVFASGMQQQDGANRFYSSTSRRRSSREQQQQQQEKQRNNRLSSIAASTQRFDVTMEAF